MGWKAVGFEQKNLADLPIAAMNPFRVREEEGKIGVEHWFTTNKRVIIPAEYNYIEQVYVKAGIFFIVAQNKKYGVYDSEGKLIVEVIYDKVYLKDNIIIVRNRSCRGAYDYNGNHIVPDKYTLIIALEDYIKVRNVMSNYGAYDYEGNHIVPDKFWSIDVVSFFGASEEFLYGKNKVGNFGIYNKKGKEIVPAIYAKITFGKNFIIANTSNSDFISIVYDYDGNVVLPRLDGHCYHSWNGIAIWYWAGNGVIVCDEKGKEFEPGIRYKGVSMHDEFLVVQLLDGRWKVLLNK